MIHANQALRTHGIAELFQSSFKALEGAIDIACELSSQRSLADIKTRILLPLVWPRYLRELAASKSPITQVHSLVLKVFFPGTRLSRRL